MSILKFKTRFLALLVLPVMVAAVVEAQKPATTRRPAQGAVVIERQPTAPQVITVLHRINGLKMLRLLIRSGRQVAAFDNLDEALQTKGVHTNIIAGLTLDDGETIAAWLPEAEVEIETTLPLFAAADAAGAPRASTPRAIIPGNIEAPGAVFSRPDITIIQRDGKSHDARYVGLDGITGLSILKLSEKNLPALPSVVDIEISVGQRMRLYSPEPVRETAAASTSNAIDVRIGEIEGQVVSVARSRAGEVNRITIKSVKLSPSNIGAVVVNDSGKTIGIVQSIEGSEANVLSPTVIRAAAKRVLARRTSVPRPWLGISGESVAFASLDRIVRRGWERQRAMSLLQNQNGILLNAVAPGSPAAVAALREGDVITRVNDNDVKSTDDFSLFLTEFGDKPVRFTIVRPNVQLPQSVTVQLSEQFDPLFGLNAFENLIGPGAFPGNPLIEHGIETVPLRSFASPLTDAAARGLLVVYVQPASAALKAGLRPGDVISAIDGRSVSALTPETKLALSNTSYTLNIVRNKEKLILTVVEREK